MLEEPTQSEIQLRIRELLGRATLLRARGQRQEALELSQQAISLDDGGWEAHELAGDLLVELGRAELALEEYRRARQLNASRAALEDKLARAALAKATRDQVATISEELLSGRAAASFPPRKPAFAALMSLIVPGLGQLYNGEVIKGFVLLALFMMSFALVGMSLKGQIPVTIFSPQGSLYGPQIDFGAIVSALFSGVTAVWVILLLLVWIYSIADAAIRASRSARSDHTGIV